MEAWLGGYKDFDNVHKEEYNNIPVHYCKNCLSIKINGEEECDYCEDCGGTNIDQCHISEWEEMFIKKNGYRYLEGKPANIYRQIIDNNLNL